MRIAALLALAASGASIGSALAAPRPYVPVAADLLGSPDRFDLGPTSLAAIAAALQSRDGPSEPASQETLPAFASNLDNLASLQAGAPAPPGGAALPKAVGDIPVPNAAFARLLPGAAPGTTSLYVSAFTGNPFGKDSVNVIPNVGAVLSTLSVFSPPGLFADESSKAGHDEQPVQLGIAGDVGLPLIPAPRSETGIPQLHPAVQTVGGSLLWPNEVAEAPAGLFGGRQGVVAAGGFLVPGKNSGGIWFSERWVFFVAS